MKDGTHVIHCQPTRFFAGNAQAMTVHALRIDYNLVTATIQIYYPVRHDPKEISYFRWNDPGISLGTDYVFFEESDRVTCFSELLGLLESNPQLVSEIVEAGVAARNEDDSRLFAKSLYFNGMIIIIGLIVIYMAIRYFKRRCQREHRINNNNQPTNQQQQGPALKSTAKPETPESSA